jgi:hypothetical protein
VSDGKARGTLKTYGFLKSEKIDPATVRDRFAGKQVEILRAIHNPDHSAAAVQALTAMLKAQGITDEQIEGARWNVDHLHASTWSERPSSLEQARRRPKRWRLIYRSIQTISLFLLILGIYSDYRERSARQGKVDDLIAHDVISGERYQDWRESGIFTYYPDVSGYRKPGYDVIAYEVTQSTRSTDDLNEMVLQRYASSQGVPGSVLSAVLVWAALLLFGPIKIAMWRWPARILLLRPFNTQDVSKALKRFIRRNVTFSGHVFTLADRHMKESLFLHIMSFVPLSPEGFLMLFLYPWSKRSRRRIYVKRAADFRALQARLGGRRRLNIFWANSWADKIRKVRTVNRWWQRCIDLLATHCEVIIIDLTVVRSGTRWELSTLRDRGLEPKAVFIVQRGQLEPARAVLAEYWPDAILPRIYAYDEEGRAEKFDAFADDFANILSLPRPAALA